MTGDFLLDQFQLIAPEPNIFRIGQYTPVSIRDQIVRSCYLVERMWRVGVLSRDTRLLVVGSGAAGVTAAFQAIGLGVRRVDMVDQEDGVLSLQSACSTRWLDPAQYDWPGLHWTGEKWPIDEPAGFANGTATKMRSPVRLQAGYADEWTLKFKMAVDIRIRSGALNFYPQHQVTRWDTVPGGGYEVFLQHPQTLAPHPTMTADVIIFAGGLGREIVHAPIHGTPSAVYKSLPFWSDDEYESLNFGLGSKLREGVLVSGAGDGALQDFIRLVTGAKSARDLWLVVAPLISQDALQNINALWHWEELAQRSFLFSPAYGVGSDRIAALHARYQSVIDGLVGDVKQWKTVTDVLDHQVGVRPVEKVFLALRTSHFDGCYPLNRLVALLCIAYIRYRHPAHSPVILHHAVTGTQPSDPAVAWGASVNVELTDLTTGTAVWRPFDSIVIRHGIDTESLKCC